MGSGALASEAVPVRRCCDEANDSGSKACCFGDAKKGWERSGAASRLFGFPTNPRFAEGRLGSRHSREVPWSLRRLGVDRGR
jgi:hypothetical protein